MKSLLAALACAGLLALAAVDRSDESRRVVVALESDDLAELCDKAGVRLVDGWARAKAMGVTAAVVRPKSLEDALRRGEVLRFDRDELERWKAVGLLPPAATLRPDTFWTKEPRLFGQLLEAITRQGVVPTTAAVAGYHVIEIPAGRDVELRGYDPERVAAAAGLAVLYADGPRAKPAPDGGEPWLEAAFWRVGQSSDVLLRRAFSHPRRLLIARLDGARELDQNLDAVRGALRELQRRGAVTDARRPDDPARAPWAAPMALAAAWLFGVLAPLFAARGGLVALRRARRGGTARAPVLSPVAQLAAGIAAAATAAAFAGAAIHALSGVSGPPLASRWAFAALSGPLVVALLTLYTIDLDAWRARLAVPATYGALLKLGAAAAFAAFLLAPRWTLQQLGVWGGLRAAASGLPVPWWLSWRWRELLVGWPCFMQALILIDWRLECPDCASLPQRPANDPRGWFMLGLLAPIGIVTGLGQGALPVSIALSQAAWALAGGVAVGAAGLVLRLRLMRHSHPGTKGPEHS